MTDAETTFWVSSELQPSGEYAVCFAVDGDDDHKTLVPQQEALRHVRAILDVAARAGFDAAVVRQLTTLGVDLDQAAAALAIDLRPDRPPIDTGGMLLITAEPGVTAEGKPFLKIAYHGKPIGQWELSDAYGHARHILELLATLPLEAQYRRILINTFNLDPVRATNAVYDLRRFRTES